MQRLKLLGLLVALAMIGLGSYGIGSKWDFEQIEEEIINCRRVWMDRDWVVFVLQLEWGNLTTTRYPSITPCPEGRIDVWLNRNTDQVCTPQYQLRCPQVPLGYLLLILVGILIVALVVALLLRR